LPISLTSFPHSRPSSCPSCLRGLHSADATQEPGAWRVEQHRAAKKRRGWPARRAVMADERPARILVVDDERATREMLGEMATALGYRVSMAASGAEALQAATADPPDAMLLDVRLPGASGLEVCRQLRANPRTVLTP